MNYAIFFTDLLNIEFYYKELVLVEVVDAKNLETKLTKLQKEADTKSELGIFNHRIYIAMPTMYPVSLNEKLSEYKEDVYS